MTVEPEKVGTVKRKVRSELVEQFVSKKGQLRSRMSSLPFSRSKLNSLPLDFHWQSHLLSNILSPFLHCRHPSYPGIQPTECNGSVAGA